ncbi:hypothetical protein CQW23_30761 [Capsicum baccatum]|uniref:Calmodulin-binding domain-containing protein n=1 Tax=Capsicum baccatum TaxID=33114 RepID=A0A2G2V9N1_CAPBA|nr:hypothetical protein CQW23_30761 [Capsicum baccatum]
MRRDGTNKLNPEMFPEKPLRTPKVKASPKSSSHLQSRPLSNEEDKKKVVKTADSALGEYTSSNKKLLHIAEAETVGKNQKKTLRKGKTGVDGDKSNTIPISGKIVLRRQDVQEKKDVQGLLNNVIEETASKLVETGKSKVKALVGAFETVISLLNKTSVVAVS